MIDYSRVSGNRTSVSKMNEVVSNIPRKVISFRHLGVGSSAHKLSKDRESENPQNLAGREEAKIIEGGKTSTSPAKSSSSLEYALMRAECFGAKLGDEERDLTMAEKDCVLTSNNEDVEDLSAFVTERLQCLSEGSVEELIGDASVNMEEILTLKRMAVTIDSL